jgi:nicotinate phosphoribosyltransferase
LTAFRAYARAAPNNCVFLVDTYDSLEGTRHAIEAAAELARAGGALAGIRLDSGDLAYLSVEARRLLNEAGCEQARIIGSGDLDEHIIESLHNQGAAIDAWGVGTRLVTGYEDPALTAVYKLTAVRGDDGRWTPRIKLSEQMAKMNIPGVLQVRRFSAGGQFAGDAIFDEQVGAETPCEMVDPQDPTRRKTAAGDWSWEDLLQPVLKGGELAGELPSVEAARERCRQQLEHLHPGIKRLMNPHQYPAGIERRLHELRTSLITRTRRQVQRQSKA